MKITTWNVNSLRTRLAHVGAFLDAEKPDALLIQETKVEDALFPLEAFAERGYEVAFHGQKSYNGVAIAARGPLKDVEWGFGGVDMEGQARVISATLGSVRLVCAYVVNGQTVESPAFAIKERFYKALAEHVRVQVATHGQVVVGGDFNISADERDVDRPERRAREVLFTPQERAWLADFSREAGVKDALRLVSDEAGLFSWWDYRFGAFERNSGMRIDYLFVSGPLEGRCEAVAHHKEERGRVQPSDHIPVTLVLRD